MSQADLNQKFDTALSLHQKGLVDQAYDAYLGVLSRYPRHDKSLFYISKILISQNKYDEAHDYLTRLFEINPHMESARDLFLQTCEKVADRSEYVRQLDQLIVQNHRDLSLWLKKINYLIDERKFAEADFFADDALKIFANDYQIVNLKAHICSRRGRYSQAVAHFEKSLTVKNEVQTYVSYSEFLLGWRQTEECLSLLDRAKRKGTPFERLSYLQARAFWILGDLNRAFGVLSAHLSGHAMDVDSWVLLGQLHRSNKDYVRAKKCFDRALALDPKSNEAASELSSLLSSLGDFKGGDEKSQSLHSEKKMKMAFDQVHLGFFNQPLGLASKNWEEVVLNRDVTVIDDLKKIIPLWNGEDLSQKHVLVLCEREVSENLLFLSCIPYFEGKVACLTLVVNEELIPLLKQNFSFCRFVSNLKLDEIFAGESEDPLDYFAPLASLFNHVVTGKMWMPCRGYLRPAEAARRGRKIGFDMVKTDLTRGTTRDLNPANTVLFKEEVTKLADKKSDMSFLSLSDFRHLPKPQRLIEMVKALSELDWLFTRSRLSAHLGLSLGRRVCYLADDDELPFAALGVGGGEGYYFFPKGAWLKPDKPKEWADVFKDVAQML